jgi:hypothetical protein
MSQLPSRRARLTVAIIAGALGAVVATYKLRLLGTAGDFGVWWLAARALLAGADPYTVIRTGAPYAIGPTHLDSGFMYPLPAALVTVPVANLPAQLGAVIFCAVGVGLLAFAVTRDGWNRWPLLASFPMIWCIESAQWAPYVTAAALLPALGWLAACKPTLGIAAFLYRPSVRFVVTGVAICILGLLVMPDWPARWIAATGQAPAGNYHIPLMVPGGIVLLAAGLRWRRPEARLLLAMACVPQSMFPYDQLALGLVPSTRIQSYVYAIWTYLAFWTARAVMPLPEGKANTLAFLARITVWTIYIPLLIVVLRRPNEGPLPAWAERFAARFPPWFRGAAEPADAP